MSNFITILIILVNDEMFLKHQFSNYYAKIRPYILSQLGRCLTSLSRWPRSNDYVAAGMISVMLLSCHCTTRCIYCSMYIYVRRLENQPVNKCFCLPSIQPLNVTLTCTGPVIYLIDHIDNVHIMHNTYGYRSGRQCYSLLSDQ